MKRKSTLKLLECGMESLDQYMNIRYSGEMKGLYYKFIHRLTFTQSTVN